MPKRRAIDEDSEIGSVDASSDEECQPRAPSPSKKAATLREGDTIEPKDAAERHIAAVRASRIDTKAKHLVECTMEDLMSDDGSSPVLYVPAKHRHRILRLYGGHTIEDFDQLYSFNSKIGAPFDNCFKSMMFYMNLSNGDLEDQWDKVAHERVLKDVFNIIQSAVRSRVGECVWYE